MGIQLDWQIEVEQTRQNDQEDPESKRARRRARRNIILVSLGVAFLVCSIVVGGYLRLQAVDRHITQQLRTVAHAEFSALSIGNESAFMNLQRSDSQPWLESQQRQFENYQILKQTERLTGDFEVVDVTIDDQRGRVVVQEEIDGITYQQVWFYWNYTVQDDNDTDSGWRRVPPDVTFWGNEATETFGSVSITYYDLDQALAQALGARLETWWSTACTLLDCQPTPGTLTVIVDPQAPARYTWEPATDGWRLRIVSPILNSRLQVDQPLPDLFEQHIADILGKRLIEHVSGGRLNFPDDDVIEFDSAWLKYELLDWLMSRFLQGESPFMDSIQEVFGPTAPGRIAKGTAERQQINVLAQAIDPTISGLTAIDIQVLSRLNWEQFFSWRLGLERQRLTAGDLTNFYSLYEGGQANTTAQGRALDSQYRLSPVEIVREVTLSLRDDGILVATVELVDASNIVSTVRFTWNGDTFLRSN